MLAAWFLDSYRTELAHISVDDIPLYVRPSFVGIQIWTWMIIRSVHLKNLSVLLCWSLKFPRVYVKAWQFLFISVRREKWKKRSKKWKEWFTSILEGATGKEWTPTQRFGIHFISKMKIKFTQLSLKMLFIFNKTHSLTGLLAWQPLLNAVNSNIWVWE